MKNSTIYSLLAVAAALIVILLLLYYFTRSSEAELDRAHPTVQAQPKEDVLI